MAILFCIQTISIVIFLAQNVMPGNDCTCACSGYDIITVTTIKKEDRHMKRVVLALSLACAALVAGGCAKQELVKRDDQLATAATATPPAKELPRQQQPAQQATVAPQTAVQQTKVEAARPSSGSELNQSSLERIYFAFDSNALTPEARATLAKHADLLKKNKSLLVRIEGNCDERGSDEYNLALGEKRAIAARQYLITLGTPAERLSVISYGREKPADQGHDESACARNRRDEFVVTAR
jgi:peptidoglycan-associated lipoprotein